MEEDRTLQILFVNTFFLLNNAAQLNLPRFLSDLADIREAMQNYNKKSPPLPQFLNIAISSLVVAKFLVNFINLAAHVIATFPIMQEENMQLLLPTILFQAVDKILLNCIEIILSFIIVRYWTHKYSLFLVVFIKIGIKMAFSFYVLNIYAEYFQSKAIFSEPSGTLAYELFTVFNELPLQLRTEDKITSGLLTGGISLTSIIFMMSKPRPCCTFGAVLSVTSTLRRIIFKKKNKKKIEVKWREEKRE